MHAPDTIAAIATASGSAGVGIVRISGSLAYDIGSKITQHQAQNRHAHYGDFVDAQNQLIDRGISLYFQAPHSFTGEDVFELQAHGGTGVLNLLLELCLYHGARLARAGEFSERAYLNNRIDIGELEAISALISSTTQAQVRAASRSLAGVFEEQVQQFLQHLIHLRSHVEATLDFADEDIDFLQAPELKQKMQNLVAQIQQILKNARCGQLLQQGMQIVILGVPNVGKSSLLNQLAGANQAIVSNIAGTTRDVIQTQINLDGMPLNLLDTAGLHASCDPIEQEGIKRAWQAVAKADKILLLCDAKKGIGAAEQDILAKLPPDLRVDVVFNKIDLYGMDAKKGEQNQHTEIYLSSKTGQGVDLLRAHLKNSVGFNADNHGAFSARERHVAALCQVAAAVEAASLQIQQQNGELAAAELYQAQQHLNSITGEFNQEQLLGEIFAGFCIGK